jgi:hypothetical protein
MTSVYVGEPSLDDRSANTPRVTSLADVHVDALRSVLGANIRYGLEETVWSVERWGAHPLVATYPYPIVLPLVKHHRLPALSVWRKNVRSVRAKKQEERRSLFAVRYWMGDVARDQLSDVWPILQVVIEILMRTLEGNAIVDLAGPVGDPFPSSDLLIAAGFRDVGEIAAAGDFGLAGSNYFPLMELNFEATHPPALGSYAFDPDAQAMLTELLVDVKQGERSTIIRAVPDEDDD